MATRKKAPEGDELEGFSADPFTEEERKFLRKMMQEEMHVAWFWATIRRWAFWMATIVAGIVAFRENIKAMWLWFVK